MMFPMHGAAAQKGIYCSIAFSLPLTANDHSYLHMAKSNEVRVCPEQVRHTLSFSAVQARMDVLSSRVVLCVCLPYHQTAHIHISSCHPLILKQELKLL